MCTAIATNMRSARTTLFNRGQRYQKPGAEDAVRDYVMLARELGMDAAQLAIAFVTSRPFVTANIIGATTMQQLKAEGVAVKTGQFPFMANGRALGQGESGGFVKIIADARTDRILGGHIIHAHASELIQELVTAMEFKAAAEDIARIVHGHPTLSEVVREAALAVDKRTLNM